MEPPRDLTDSGGMAATVRVQVLTVVNSLQLGEEASHFFDVALALGDGIATKTQDSELFELSEGLELG